MEFDHELYFPLLEWESIFETISYRGRVAFDNSIKYVIHSNEQGHNKPHLHAQYQDKEVVIEISTGAILAGNLPNSKTKQASEWVLSNADFLSKKWNELTNGLKIPVL